MLYLKIKYKKKSGKPAFRSEGYAELQDLIFLWHEVADKKLVKSAKIVNDRDEDIAVLK